MAVWLAICAWLTRKIGNLLPDRGWRVVIKLTLFVALLSLPLSDEIVGGIQFRALCKENAVLNIDAKKIKGRTIHMVSDPANRDVPNTAINIHYTRVSYRDVTTQEELASNGYLVAMGGRLIRALSGGNEVTPMTIFPSTCSGPGNLPTSEKYGFKIDTRTTRGMQ
jgi:hypothetical protein